ncbi:hypothetical protein HNI00_12940 [Thermoleptolyngbya oregonensis NK1-22]|uniref:Uncharacterized protein n=1 Tax=Thermoleptolyngbya oregonensis NK1-22 TaxID=2547457 RepID=A0AA96Y8P7_9CYAN|nr:hypothetical protein [Thermoleptolyngbya oregonensis]WOB43953.1 hypothetical protein HNI00_12940 [Thermoleptolyngbya oregonensis NK1-22]
MRKLNGSSWTTQRFVQLSQDLGHAFGPGLDSAALNRHSDEWTPEKLTHLSKSLSRAFLL